MDNIKKQKEIRQRVIALLTRQEIEFLDKLGIDALFSGGGKLTRTKLISYIIDILISLGIDGTRIKTTEDLKEKIKGAIMKTLFTQSFSANKEEVKKIDNFQEVQNEKR